jgi:hypothetical protein
MRDKGEACADAESNGRQEKDVEVGLRVAAGIARL